MGSLKQKIDQVFAPVSENSRIRLMTHIVAGYPSFEANLKCVKAMEESGVSMVEVQIPFSDPMADGSTIMKANQIALDNGVNVAQVLSFLKELTDSVKIPILIMSYYNLLYRMGLEIFFAKAEVAGVSGLIIPDIPFDNPEHFFERVSKYDLYPVAVISPGISEDRLNAIVNMASGMIYTTLRVGVTGTKKSLDSFSTEFLDNLKKVILKKTKEGSLSVAAGFGVASVEQVDYLKDKVDMVVIGSYIIKLFEQYPVEQAIKEMTHFLQACCRIS